MAGRTRLTAAVVFVSDLDRSRDFYRQLLELDVSMATGEALLLSTADEDHLVLHARPGAMRASGGLGVQYLVWTASDSEGLDRCERVLQEWGAHVSTQTDHGIKIVRGHDPDRIPVFVNYPAGPGVDATTLPAWVFAY